jgi:hypothetical protein
LILRRDGPDAKGSIWDPSKTKDAVKHTIANAPAVSLTVVLTSSSHERNERYLLVMPLLLPPEPCLPPFSGVELRMFSRSIRATDMKQVLANPSNVTFERVNAVLKTAALVPVMMSNNRPELGTSCKDAGGLSRSMREGDNESIPLRRSRYVKTGRSDFEEFSIWLPLVGIERN